MRNSDLSLCFVTLDFRTPVDDIMMVDYAKRMDPYSVDRPLDNFIGKNTLSFETCLMVYIYYKGVHVPKILIDTLFTRGECCWLFAGFRKKRSGKLLFDLSYFQVLVKLEPVKFNMKLKYRQGKAVKIKARQLNFLTVRDFDKKITPQKEKMNPLFSNSLVSITRKCLINPLID